MKKVTGFYPCVQVDTTHCAAVGQAGGVLLTDTIRVSGLDVALSAALGRWRKPGAQHDPAKIVADLAVSLALGGDCLADVGCYALNPGKTLTAIATELGQSTSTVSREVARNSGPNGYRVAKADRLAVQRTAGPRQGKLADDPTQRRYVEDKLRLRWSPQQISRRLIVDYPHDRCMRVSHETIHTSLLVQTKAVLRTELTAHLRTRRVRWRPHQRAIARAGSPAGSRTWPRSANGSRRCSTGGCPGIGKGICWWAAMAAATWSPRSNGTAAT